MFGLQVSTSIAFLMLLRLHLKDTLPPPNNTQHPATHQHPIEDFTIIELDTLPSRELLSLGKLKRRIRNINSTTNSATNNNTQHSHLKILSLLPNSANTRFENEALVVFSDTPTQIKFMTPLPNPAQHNNTTYQLTFTHTTSQYGDVCDDHRDSDIFNVTDLGEGLMVSDVVLKLDTRQLHICTRVNNPITTSSKFVHQDPSSYANVLVQDEEERSTLMPVILQGVVIVVLLIMSGLFSGLNLGLMSLDKTELSIMIASGTKREKKYAKKILPLRKKGNFLLCTILLGNVLVNNCLTILLDDLTGSGLSAIVASTFAIVLFGEIIPQAVCSRYGLAIGANTIYFTYFFMIITSPLSFPISFILDKILGEEIGQYYNRDRLRELLKLTEKDMDLQIDEFNIITGALDLSKKNVKSVMTKIDDVFMIEYNTVLDFATVTTIMESGYTRVPIYEKNRSNIVDLLNVKDLALVDPDNRIAVKTVTQFFKHNVIFVFEDYTLDVILSDFKKGGSHMAMVRKVVSEEDKDPHYEVTGVVTLEDVIEEIIQAEIYDEFDTITDNISKLPRSLINKKDFSLLQSKPSSINIPQLSPQIKLATLQYLSATLTPFKPPYLTERILNRLLNQNIVINHTYNENIPLFLFQHSKQVDYFILIIEGRVSVRCGLENLMFESGPYSYFGLQALLVPSFRNPSFSTSLYKDEEKWVLPSGGFTPDYSVKAITNLVYIKIRRDQYAVAHNATKVRDSSILTENADEIFEKDWKFNNQVYVAETREDRLRRHIRQQSLRNSSTFTPFIPPYKNSTSPTNRLQLSNNYSSFFSSIKKNFAKTPPNNSLYDNSPRTTRVTPNVQGVSNGELPHDLKGKLNKREFPEQKIRANSTTDIKNTPTSNHSTTPSIISTPIIPIPSIFSTPNNSTVENMLSPKMNEKKNDVIKKNGVKKEDDVNNNESNLGGFRKKNSLSEGGGCGGSGGGGSGGGGGGSGGYLEEGRGMRKGEGVYDEDLYESDYDFKANINNDDGDGVDDGDDDDGDDDDGDDDDGGGGKRSDDSDHVNADNKLIGGDVVSRKEVIKKSKDFKNEKKNDDDDDVVVIGGGYESTNGERL